MLRYLLGLNYYSCNTIFGNIGRKNEVISLYYIARSNAKALKANLFLFNFHLCTHAGDLH